MAYARIEEGFWTDPKIKSLPIEGKLIAAWLFTNPHRHFSGLYYLPTVLIGVEIGVSVKVSEETFKLLEKQGFLKYSQEFSVVWVINMLKHQSGGKKLSAQQVTGIVRHLSTLHGCPLIDEFIAKYHTLGIKYEGKIDISIDTPTDTKSQSQSQSKYNPPTPLRGSPVPFQEIIDLWNTHAPELLPRITLTDKRKPKIKAAWTEHQDLEWWRTLFTDIDLSDWHSHRDSWQGCSFDWILKNRTEMREKLNAKKGNGKNKGLVLDSKKQHDPGCPRCRGSGTYQSGTMPDNSPAYKTCNCEMIHAATAATA